MLSCPAALSSLRIGRLFSTGANSRRQLGKFDVAIVGGGPGGYVAAIRAAQLGMKTACVDQGVRLGGTCLNVGCIPSKSLLHSSEFFEQTKKHVSAFGVKVRGVVDLDLKAAMKQKDRAVRGLGNGIEHLFKKHGVKYIRGNASLLKRGLLSVRSSASDEPSLMQARHVVLAVGSEPTPLPGVEFDEERVVSSTGALAFKTVPKRLIVVGAGVIGLELGSVWRRFGSEVSFVEYLPRLAPGIDAEIAAELRRVLEAQGLKFILGHKVEGVSRTADGVSVAVSPAKGGAQSVLEADAVLVAIGRRPNLKNCGLERLKVAVDRRGFISTKPGSYETSVRGLHAIGDCVPGPMLAHKASEEGIACVERIAGVRRPTTVHYNTIPGVVYTDPEVASVGLSEEEALATSSGSGVKVGRFSFAANSRARAIGGAPGLAKVVADARGRVVGVHIIGPSAGEMIHEGAIAIQNELSLRQLGSLCHAHPTFSEAVKEAALDAMGEAIHV